MSYVNTFGEGTVQSADTSYTRYDLTLGNLVLFWPAAFQDTLNVVYDFMNITSGVGGRTITLPGGNLASVGVSFKFINVGGQSIVILNSLGTPLLTITAGQAWELYLTDNTTDAGLWSFIPAGNGTSGVVSFNSVQPTAGLTVSQNDDTGAIIQTFALANDLLALENLGSTGYAVRTTTDTWAQRTFVAGANIALTNPAGIAGNTTIALNASLTNMVAINVGTINLSTNIISTTQANQDLILAPNGTGVVQSNNRVSIKTGKSLLFYNDSDTFFTSIDSSTAAASTVYTLPTNYPTLNNQVLASTTLGVMSWINATPVIQIVSNSSSVATTTTALIPYDNTAPLITEGAQLITVNITPRFTGKLIVEFTASISNTSNANTLIIALFQDATANSLNAGSFFNSAGSTAYPLILRHVIAAAVAGVPTTFSIRYGLDGAGTAYMLTGNNATNTLGGVPQMSLTVTELAP